MAKIDLIGFDELNTLLEEMTLTEEDERRAIKAALEPVKKEVIINIPVKTNKLQNSVTTKISKEKGQIVGKVVLGEYYGRFLEYGTSKSSKHRGFFAKSIKASKDRAMKILKKEILERLK